ncbi:MAG: sulfate reduction electron transfer complex DsrMKJOP subunit DsrO [Candidatus Bathyarchaeia archaeon]
MAEISRRSFLKYVAALGGMILFRDYSRIMEAFVPRKVPFPDGGGGASYGMVIDVGACVGCRQCMYACKRGNNIPDEPIPMAWIEVFELDMTTPVSKVHGSHLESPRTAYTRSPKEGKWYLSVNCFHCDNPPCVKVCPVGATYKGEGGIVEMDYDKCIGCRNCMAACPYNARRFNLAEPEIPPERVNPQVPVRQKGVVEKCTFCQHRVREGKQPYCVEACPVGARRFGDLNDPESPVSRLLESYTSFRLLEEMNTQPRVFYITSGKKWLLGG